MKFIEHLKEDYAKVKDKPRKEKIGFFWDYYKIPIICLVLVLVLLIQGVASVVNKRDIVFSAVLLNCKVVVDEDDFLDGFYEYAGIDASKDTAAFYSDMLLIAENKEVSLNTIQRIIAGISVQDTDFIAAPTDAFLTCAYHSGYIFHDLRTFLDAETLEKLSGRLYYADYDIIDQINAELGVQVEPDAMDYPVNPKDPSTMKKPVPVGIDISDRTGLKDAYYTSDQEVFMGIVANTPRPELTRTFINYLFA